MVRGLGWGHSKIDEVSSRICDQQPPIDQLKEEVELAVLTLRVEFSMKEVGLNTRQMHEMEEHLAIPCQ